MQIKTKELWFRFAAICIVLVTVLCVTLSGCKRATVGESSVPSSSNPSSAASGSLQTAGKLTAMFWNVGQGDSMFLTLPDGKTALIDAGESENGYPIVAYLMNHHIEKIDYVIATHPHSDHIGGMDEVISSFHVGKLFFPSLTKEDIPDSDSYKDFMNAVTANHYELTTPKAGTILFEGEGYKAECLAPIGTGYGDLNNYSIVFKLTYGSNSFLFAGDCEKEEEKEIREAGYNLKADVLKVGHHGSDTSNGKKFLEQVKPKYAVIPCSGDTDNHPNADTVTKLKNLGATVYRTDYDGNVIITSDGKDISVQKNADGPNK